MKSSSFDYPTARRLYEMIVNTALSAYPKYFQLTATKIDETKEQTLRAALKYLNDPSTDASVLPESLRDYVQRNRYSLRNELGRKEEIFGDI